MIDIKKSYNWSENLYSNPRHDEIIFDNRLSTLEKINHVKSQQRAPFSLGVYVNRKIDESNRRPSPFGLVPSIVKPNHGLVWEYNGATHNLPNTYDYNLQQNQPY